MNSKIEVVLKKLIDSGFDAYVVGGYVRDFLLGKESYDVDITTNAKPVDIMNIFKINTSIDSFGKISFKDSYYHYDIMPYREELKYDNRRPIDFKFTNDFDKDSIRRDFTINALYMDINGNIIDPFDGKKDLKDKTIRVIGDVNTKLCDDPLRILRAIRFASILNFDLDESLKRFIKENKYLLKTLSFDRRKLELDKIFKNENKTNGINLIKELDLESSLELKFNDFIKYTISSEGIWAQIETNRYNFTRQEKAIIDAISRIVNYGIIDNVVLYQFGLYPCVIAGEILGINEAHVSNLYSFLPIYTKNDINYSGDDIIDLLKIEPGIKVKKIISDIELNILDGDLENSKEKIEDYIIKNWK